MRVKEREEEGASIDAFAYYFQYFLMDKQNFTVWRQRIVSGQNTNIW